VTLGAQTGQTAKCSGRHNILLHWGNDSAKERGVRCAGPGTPSQRTAETMLLTPHGAGQAPCIRKCHSAYRPLPAMSPAKRTARAGGFSRPKALLTKAFLRRTASGEKPGCQVRYASLAGCDPLDPASRTANGPFPLILCETDTGRAETLLMGRRTARTASIAETKPACSAKGPPRSRDEASHRR
jgi:hypothetical protein